MNDNNVNPMNNGTPNVGPVIQPVKPVVTPKPVVQPPMAPVGEPKVNDAPVTEPIAPVVTPAPIAEPVAPVVTPAPVAEPVAPVTTPVVNPTPAGGMAPLPQQPMGTPMNNVQPMGTPLGQPMGGPQPMGAPMNNMQPPINNGMPNNIPNQYPNNMPPIKKQGGSNTGLLIGGGILLLIIICVVLFFVIKPFNSSSYVCTKTQTEDGMVYKTTSKISKTSKKGAKVEEEVEIYYADGTKFTETERAYMEKYASTVLGSTASNIQVKLSNGKLILSGTITDDTTEETLDEIKSDAVKDGYTCK